jgi:DNA-binding transcriptional regulator YiaG
MKVNDEIKMSKAGKQILKAMKEVLKGDFITYTVPVKGLVDVKAIRDSLEMERDEFAHAFNLSKYSVRNWELGKRIPSGSVLALLQIIASDPMSAYNKLHPHIKHPGS